MIAVDTNILVYAHREDSPWHDSANASVVELAEGRALWAIPWPCVHEFLAIVTHLRIYSPPTLLAAAIDQIEAWLESPSLMLLKETEGYWTQFLNIPILSYRLQLITEGKKRATSAFPHDLPVRSAQSQRAYATRHRRARLR